MWRKARGFWTDGNDCHDENDDDDDDVNHDYD